MRSLLTTILFVLTVSPQRPADTGPMPSHAYILAQSGTILGDRRTVMTKVHEYEQLGCTSIGVTRFSDGQFTYANVWCVRVDTYGTDKEAVSR